MLRLKEFVCTHIKKKGPLRGTVLFLFYAFMLNIRSTFTNTVHQFNFTRFTPR